MTPVCSRRFQARTACLWFRRRWQDRFRGDNPTSDTESPHWGPPASSLPGDLRVPWCRWSARQCLWLRIWCLLLNDAVSMQPHRWLWVICHYETLRLCECWTSRFDRLMSPTTPRALEQAGCSHRSQWGCYAVAPCRHWSCRSPNRLPGPGCRWMLRRSVPVEAFHLVWVWLPIRRSTAMWQSAEQRPVR